MNDEIRIGSIVCRNQHLVTLEDMHITAYWRNGGSALCTLYLKNLKTEKGAKIDIGFDFDTDQDIDISYDMDPDDPGTEYIKSINIYKDIMYYQPNKLDTSVVRRCARKLNMSEGQIYDLIKYAANTLKDSFKSDINKQLMEEYEETIIESEGPNSFYDSRIFIDEDVLLNKIHETCEKGRAAITDEEKEWYHVDDSIKDKNRNMPKHKIDLKNISDRPTIDILSKIIENKNSELIVITIDDYKFLDSDFENARFYGTIELHGINTEKTYSFDIMFNSYEFKDENGKPIDMLTLCKEIEIDTGTLRNTLDKLKKEAQPYIIRHFYLGY